MNWKKIWAMYEPFRRHIGVVLGFTAVQQALAIVSPYILGRVIDFMIKARPFRETMFLGGLALTTGVARTLVGYWKDSYELKHLDFSISQHVQKSILAKMLEFSIGQHASENSGVKMSVMARGQSSITQLTNMVLYNIAPQLLGTIVLLIATCFISPLLGSVLVIGATLYVGLIVYDAISARKPLRELEELRHKEGKVRGEHIRNIRLVITNAQEARALRESDESFGRVSTLGRALWSRLQIRGTLRSVLLEIVRFSVLITGVWMVYDGKYTPGYLVIFLSWSSNALGNITSLGQMQRTIVDLYTGSRKYFEMTDIEPDVCEVENPLRLGHVRGKIELRNISYSYPARKSAAEEEGEDVVLSDRTPVATLHGVTLQIEPGERVALVGESGAGKSTIVSLILRAQDPQEGEVLLDDKDLRLLSKTELRNAIGLVEQDVTLYDQTLRYNLTYGLGERADLVGTEEIMNACRIARVDHFFGRLERGLDTMIGERGVKLSGGERQRVGIARALVKDPRILILDEATSSLDAENEKLIQDALEEAAEGRTTIVIAHRFSTIKNADRIYVVNRGKIVDAGRYEELAQCSSEFQRLMRHQSFVR